MNERDYIRSLAEKLAIIGSDPEQKEKAVRVRRCNNLDPDGAVVFARPENGWPDLIEKWGPLQCSDPVLRRIEEVLQKKIIRASYIRDDKPVLPEIRIPMRIRNNTYNDFGVHLDVTESEKDRGAYHIEPAIKEWSDLGKLHFRKLAVDRKGSDEDFRFAQDLLGDLLNVRQTGVVDWRYGLTRILIHMRGFQRFLMDFYDYPDETHQIMKFLQDNFQKEIEYYTGAGLITANSRDDDYIGVGGPCATDDLPDDNCTTVKDCLVWAEAQETVGVSPAQFEEFVFQHQKPLIDLFGLCGYGCCEGLDDRFHILKNGLSNLRWVAVSPWANAEKMADQLGKDYVYLRKVNPSMVVSPRPDWDAAEKEVREVHDITKGMAVQFSLKDTNTFCGEPERITRWVEMVRRIVS